MECAIRLHLAIGLYIIFYGILWQCVDNTSAQSDEKEKKREGTKDSSAAHFRDDFDEACRKKSPCRLCNDIATVKAVCKMRHFCEKNDKASEKIPREKSMGNYVSEKICCKKNVTFNLHNFQCHGPKIDVEKLMNSTADIFGKIRIKDEYKEWIMKFLSKMRGERKTGERDEKPSHHHTIGSALKYFLDNVYINEKKESQCKKPTADEKKSNSSDWNEKYKKSEKDGKEKDKKSEEKFGSDAPNNKHDKSDRDHKSNGFPKKDGKSEKGFGSSAHNEKGETSDSGHGSKVQNKKEKSTERDEEGNVRGDPPNEKNEKYKGRNTEWEEMEAVCKNARENSGYCQCHVMRLISKLKTIIDFMDTKSSCPFKSRMEKECKENEIFCVLTGKCQDRRSCVLFLLGEDDKKHEAGSKRNRTSNEKDEAADEKDKPAGGKDRFADKKNLGDGKRFEGKEKPEDLKKSGGDEKRSNPYQKKTGDGDWGKRWQKTCEVMDTLCRRIDKYEEEYGKICTFRRHGNESGKSNNSLDKQPRGGEPDKLIHSRRFDGPLYVFLSFKHNILSDIRNEMKRNMKTSKDSYSLFNPRRVNYKAKIMGTSDKGKWSCIYSKRDDSLKEGESLDMQECSLRWHQADDGCMFSFMNITIRHPKEERYLFVSLIWAKPKAFESHLKVATEIKIRGRVFDFETRDKYLAAEFNVSSLLSGLKMQVPSFEFKMCNQVPRTIIQMIIRKAKSFGVDMARCKKLLPYVLGCTKKYQEKEFSFPGFLQIGERKIECAGKDYEPKPFPVKLNDRIQMWPQYGLSDMVAHVWIFFACPFEFKMKNIYKDLVEFFGGFNNIVLPIQITKVKKYPKFSQKYAFLPPVEYLKADRKPFPIASVMYGDPFKYKLGFKKGSVSITRYFPFVQNVDRSNNKSGIAVVDVYYSKENVGKFFYKCSEDDFKEVSFPKEKVLLLHIYCLLKFEPSSRDINWKIQDAYLTVLAWDGSGKGQQGLQGKEVLQGGGYSKDKARLFISKYGCDGIVGSVIKCKPKCDNQMNSDAKLDICGVCYGGRSNQTKDSKTYKVFDKKYKKESLRCCKTKVVCNMCPTAKKKEGGCEPACVNGRPVPGYKVCGECVGGKSGKTEDQLRDKCGNCINEKNEETKTCSAPANQYISIVRPKSINSALAFQVVDICFMGLEKKAKKAKEVTCTLSKEGSENTCPLVKTLNQVRGVKNIKRGCMIPMLRKDKLNCGRWFTSRKCPIGNYKLACKYKEKKYHFSEPLIIKDKRPAISSITPSIIGPGKKISLVFEIEGMEDYKKYWCCFKSHTNKSKCFRSKEKEGKSLHCTVFFRNSIPKLNAYVRDCNNMESNEFPFAIRCTAPNPVSVQVTRRKEFSLIIKFDNPAVLHEGDECKNYRMLNRYRMGVKNSAVSMGAELLIPKKCFSCPGGVPGEGAAKIDMPQAKCSIKSTESVNECSNLRLSPRMIGFKSCEWNVHYTEGAPGDDANLKKLNAFNSSLKNFKSGFVLKKDPAVWSIAGRKFTFKMKALSMLNQLCEVKKDVIVTSANTMECRLLKPWFFKNGNAKVAPKIKYCRKSKYFYNWEVRNNDTDTIISGLETSKRKLLLNRYILGNGKQDLKVSLTVSLQNNTNISCSTGEMEVRMKEIPLELTLARNKQLIRTLCMKKRFVLFARTASPPLREDVFEWNCYDDNGDACVDKETDTPLVLDARRKLELDLSEKLLCGQEYTFSVMYSRGNQSVMKSVIVAVQDALPPNIRCRPFREEDDGFELVCLIQRANRNNVTFENIMTNEDESVLNISEVIVTKRTLRKAHTKLEVFISKELMNENVNYQFVISASNDNGEAEDVNLELKWYPPPSGCKVRVTPQTGIAFQDKFSVTMEECEVDEDEELTFRIGPVLEENGEWRYLESPVSEVDIGELPEGEIIIRAEVQGFKSAIFETTINVAATNKSGDEILIGGVKDMEDAIENGDVEKALSDSCRAVDGARAKFKKSITSSECKQPDDWDAMTDEVADIMDKVASTEEKTLKEAIMRGMSCTAEKICPQRSISTIKKKAFLKMFQEQRMDSSMQLEKSRKRRSIETSDESASSTTFLSKEQVKNDLTTFTNALFPIRYEDEDKELKKDFRAYVSPAKKSICSWMQGASNSSVITDKIAFHSHRVANFSSVDKVTSIFGESLMFGERFKEMYDVWNCTQEDEICNGFYVATSSVKGDVFSHSANSDIQLLSNVFSFFLINPLDGGTFETIGTENDAANIKVTMMEKENITENAECQIWNSTSWTYKGCSTEREAGKVVCKCNKFGHIAVLEVPGLLVTRIQTTASPTLTSSESNYTQSPRTNSGNDMNGNSSKEGGNSATNNGTDGGMTPSPDDADSSLQSSITSKDCELTYEGDFDATVAYFNNSLDNAQSYICLETRKKMTVEKHEFKNCTIRKGSIIVTYTLVQRSDSMNQTLKFTANEMDANNFIITLPDGTTLKSQSFKVDGSDYKATEKKENSDDVAITIAIVVSVLAFLILLVLIVLLVHKSKEKRKVEPSPNGSYAQMEDNKEHPPRSEMGKVQSTDNANGHQFENPTYNEQS